MRFYAFVYIVFLGLTACRTNRNLVYLNDLRGSTEYKTQVVNNPALRIQPDDLLGITVSSLNP